MKTRFLCLFVVVAALVAQSAYADAPQKALSEADLLAMAGNPFASGELPLGDQRYTTDAAQKGSIYFCRMPRGGEGGAQHDGPWIVGDSWNYLQKPAVAGDIMWNEAQFSNEVSGDERILSGNGLPMGVPTGQFPIQASDPASHYDRNPNSIRPQTVHEVLPAHPAYSATPFCMGMEVGYMLNGVALFNGFDAALRDAAAHEVQDKCNGHPERTGQYHYHNLTPCLKDVGVKTVIGYALDGFPITGPVVAPGKYLTTENLDECHGITSEIIEDGQKTVRYHYVITQDFPYSASCFRAKPVRIGPAQGPQNGGNNMQPAGMPGGMQQGTPGGPRMPPQQAIAACSGQQEGMGCGFVSPRGDQISGTCRTPPGLQTLACVPQR